MKAGPANKIEPAELLGKLREGDALAFSEIYNQYRHKIYVYSLKLCKSEDTAEEVVQEVFVKIWQKREQINTELNFGAYIKKITLNHVLNYLKKVSRDRKLREQLFSYIENMNNTTEEQIFEKELSKIYQDAIDLLSPQKKLIYNLSRKEHLSHEEIAARLGLSRNTVKNHMVEAGRFIRAYVTKHGSIVCFIIAAADYFQSN